MLFDAENPGGFYNRPRDIYDLYTPRFVKGRGCDKVGLCPICVESVDRGGAGKKLWLSMKFSAFKWYLASPIFCPANAHRRWQSVL